MISFKEMEYMIIKVYMDIDMKGISKMDYLHVCYYVYLVYPNEFRILLGTSVGVESHQPAV